MRLPDRKPGVAEEGLLPSEDHGSGQRLKRWRRYTSAAPIIFLLVVPGVASAGDLRYGDHGRAVASLQRQLVKLGYLERGRADGIFADETWHAVVALQGWEQIARDGVVGPQTRRALRSALAPQPWLRLPRALEIDLTRQVLLVVEGGAVRRAVHVSTGASGFATPEGRFTVTRRKRMSWSQRYRVWLPYALYFDRGLALHGFRVVPDRPASHGCIRIPLDEAPLVFRASPRGTPVVIRGANPLPRR